MNNYIFAGICGIAGAAIGGLVAWKVYDYIKKDQLAVEEAEIWQRAKEHYISKSEKSPDEKSEETKPKAPSIKELTKKSPITEYEKHIKENHYDVRSDSIPDRSLMKALEKRENKDNDIRVIDDMEYAQINDEEYDLVSLSYSEEGRLTDERGNPFTEIEALGDTAWQDSVSNNGSVYILNNDLKICYEIDRVLSDYPEGEDEVG